MTFRSLRSTATQQQKLQYINFIWTRRVSPTNPLYKLFTNASTALNSRPTGYELHPRPNLSKVDRPSGRDKKEQVEESDEKSKKKKKKKQKSELVRLKEKRQQQFRERIQKENQERRALIKRINKRNKRNKKKLLREKERKPSPRKKRKLNPTVQKVDNMIFMIDSQSDNGIVDTTTHGELLESKYNSDGIEYDSDGNEMDLEGLPALKQESDTEDSGGETTDSDDDDEYIPDSSIIDTSGHIHITTTADQNNNKFKIFDDEYEAIEPETEHIYLQTVDTALWNAPVISLDLKADIGNIEVLVDTGASISVVTYNTAMKYYELIKSERVSFKVQTAQEKIALRDYIPLEIDEGDKIIRERFYVLPPGGIDEFGEGHKWLLGRKPIPYLSREKKLKILRDPTSKDDLGGEFIHKRNLDHYYAEEDGYQVDDYDYFNDEYSEFFDKDGRIKEKYKDIENQFEFGINLDARKAYYVKRLILDYARIISRKEKGKEIGNLDGYFLQINTWNNKPIKQSAYKHSPEQEQAIREQVKELLDLGVIRESRSPYASPVIIRPKKQKGEWRMCIDYRLLNAITIPDEYPLPDMNKLIRNFKGKKWFTQLDIRHGYFHMTIDPKDQEKSAFITEDGLFEYIKVPFGLRNAPSTFQRAMNYILRDMDGVQCYLDDIVIASDTYEQHCKDVQDVLDRIAEYGLKLRLDKCKWFAQEIEYLGVIVNEEGIRPQARYKSKILNMKKPTTAKEVERYLGMVQWLNKFIPDLSKFTKNISKLRHDSNKNKWYWSDQCDRDFKEIQKRVLTANLLRHPDFTKQFILQVDASDDCIGCVLLQKDDKGELVPVEFGSKTLSSIQQRWHVSEKEIFACIYFVEKFRRYLISKPFILHTDHKNLENLFNQYKNFKTGKLYRWAIRLQEYDFVAKYLKGEKNFIADYMSRYIKFPENKQFTLSETETNYYLWLLDEFDELNANKLSNWYSEDELKQYCLLADDVKQVKCSCRRKLSKEPAVIYYPEMVMKAGHVQHTVRCDYCGIKIGEKEDIYHCSNRRHKNGCDFCVKCIEEESLDPETTDSLIHAFQNETRVDYSKYFKEPPLMRSKTDPEWIPPKEFDDIILKMCCTIVLIIFYL